MRRPIVLVTGANGGVGLGVCERLLEQFSYPSPPDSTALYQGRVDPAGTPFDAVDGCTLILACRNAAKAKDAVTALQALLARMQDGEADHEGEDKGGASSARQTAQELRPRTFTTNRSAPLAERTASARAAYRRRFARGTVLEVVSLDLASEESTSACVQSVLERYPYLTHLILNAGGAAWAGINWPRAVVEMVVNLHRAVTRPSYKLQHPSETTRDGYGWVWQINCGMHYLLAVRLLPLLCKSPYIASSRIIWTGSLEASRADFHLEDFQCLDPKISPHAYESTKYQCELAALAMDERVQGSYEHAPHVYMAHPGIVASSIFSEAIHVLLLSLMRLAFYVARWTFSPHHLIDAYKGAVAASYVAVAPAEDLQPSVRYGAQSTWLGHEYVYPGNVDGWQDAGPAPGADVTELARTLLHRYDATLRLTW